MAFNINDFISNLGTAGTLQTNKFEVQIGIPPALRQYFSDTRLVAYRAEAIKVPGVTMDTTEARRYGIGPRQKFVTNVGLNDIDITFIETKDSTFQRFFYLWTNYMFDFSGVRSAGNATVPTYTTAYKEDYATDINIRLYNNRGAEEGLAAVIGIDEAYPTNLSENSLSWSNSNSLYKVNVTFGYTKWWVEDPVATGLGIGTVTREDLPPLPGVPAENYNPSRGMDNVNRLLDTLRVIQRYTPSQ